MSRSAEAIREEMSGVRSEIADDMQGVVDSAREMADWKSYVRRYPLACVGVAAVVGYFAVPKRLEVMSPDADTLMKLAKRNKLVVKSDQRAQTKSGLTGTLLSLIGNATLRAGMHLAGQKLSQAVEAASGSTASAPPDAHGVNRPR